MNITTIHQNGNIKGDFKMKKTISIVLVCVLLLGCVMSLTSCDKFLFGKYESATATYEFSGLNKVTKTRGIDAGSFTITGETEEGTYQITENDEGETVIKLTFGEETNTYDFSHGEEDGVKYIKIGIIKYTKAD